MSVCVANRALFALGVSRALLALFGVSGLIVCCDIALEAGVGVAFEAGVAADGVGEVCARGTGAAGAGDVVG